MLTDHWVMVRHAKRMRPYLKTSAVDADPLRKRRLLSIFFVNARLLLGTDIGYLSPQFLTELPSIDIKNKASFIKFSGWFSSVV